MAGIPEANLGTVQLRPQARVVDTFVSPRARAGEGKGMQLMRALAPLNKGLESYIRERQQAEDAATIDRAQSNALAAKAEIAAVQSGEMFAGESKLYQRAYKEQAGRVEGQRIRDEALLAYQEQGLQNSTDPKEFDEFLSGVLKDKLGSITDRDILHGALGVVEPATNSMRAQNAAKVSDNLQNALMDTAVTTVSGAIDTAIREAIDSGQPIDTSKVLSEISGNDQRLQFLRLPGPEFRKRLTDMVIDKAMAYPTQPISEALFSMLDAGKITTAAGKSIPLTDSYWKTNRDQARRQVEDRAYTLSGRIEEQEKRKREQEKNDALGQLAAVIAGGKRPTPAMLADVAQRFGADAARELSSTVSAIRSTADYDDAATLHSAYSQLLRGESIDADTGIRLLSRMKDPGNVGRLYDDIARVRSEADVDRLRNLRRIPSVKLALESLENAARGEGFIASVFKASPETNLKVQTGLMQDLLMYVNTHPELTPDNLDAQQQFDDYFAKRVGVYSRYATAVAAAAAAKQPAPQAPDRATPQTAAQQGATTNRFTDGAVQ